jgi:hypothetical protein
MAEVEAGTGNVASTPVDLQALANKTAELLQVARIEFEQSLLRVQDVVQSITWEQMRHNTLIDEIGEITFDNYESVTDLVSNIDFDPLRQQDLIESNIQKSKKHVFISPSLDAAEAAIVEITSKAGSGAYKNLSGVMLSNEIREGLIRGQRLADGRDHNDILAILNRYQSSDHTGNLAWIEEQYGYKLADRDRNIYSTLFTMAQANVEWAFKNGVQIERLHESFTARYNRLYMDITQANIAAYKAEVKANIAQLEGDLAEVDAEMIVAALQFEAESAEWALKVEQANSRMQSYVREYAGKLSKNLKMINTRMVGGKNVTDGYKSIYSAYSSQYSGVSLSNSGE